MLHSSRGNPDDYYPTAIFFAFGLSSLECKLKKKRDKLFYENEAQPRRACVREADVCPLVDASIASDRQRSSRTKYRRDTGEIP